MVLILIPRTGKCDVTKAMLSVFSGLVAKSLEIGGNSRKRLALYTTWLLLIGFILTSYTNILQSLITVPGIHKSHRSFEEMLQENFTFESPHFGWPEFREYSEPPTRFPNGAADSRGRRAHEVQMRKRLVERLVQYKQDPVLSFHAVMKTFSEGKERVLVLTRNEVARFKSIPVKTGWDVVHGNEQLFSVPFWWDFTYVERGSLLTRSLERIKESGIYSYSMELYNTKTENFVSANARRGFVAAGEIQARQYSAHDGLKVTLESGIVSESLLLFVYGIVTAIAGFLVEIAAKPMRRLMLAFGDKVIHLYVAFKQLISLFKWEHLKSKWHSARNQLHANVLIIVTAWKNFLAESFQSMCRRVRSS